MYSRAVPCRVQPFCQQDHSLTWNPVYDDTSALIKNSLYDWGNCGQEVDVVGGRAVQQSVFS